MWQNSIASYAEGWPDHWSTFVRCCVFKFSLTYCLLLLSGDLPAHPWGGLVIDGQGNIYFTFVSPMVGDDHYAAVWVLDQERKLSEILRSEHSPSDIVLQRTPSGDIYAVERVIVNDVYRNQMWKVTKKEVTKVPVAEEFHLQAYAITTDGSVYFAKKDTLFRYDPLEGKCEQLDKLQFSYISLLAWGTDHQLYILDDDEIKIWEGGQAISVADLVKDPDPLRLPFAGANIVFDMTIDQGGNIFLAYYGNRSIVKVTRNGQRSELLSDGDWRPHGIDVFDGALYVLESRERHRSWWRFWETPEITPRIRKIDQHGSSQVIYEY